MEQVGVVPDYATKILGSLTVEGPNGRAYVFEMLRRRRPGEFGAQGQLRVFAGRAGYPLEVLPMSLTWRSKLFAMFVMSWPPETLDSYSVEADGLAITFHETQGWDRFPGPKGFFSESIWRARYEEDRRRWRVSRVRHVQDHEWKDFETLL